MTDGLRMAAETLVRYARRPIDMVREQFHAEPDTFQAEALLALAPAKHDIRLALKACKGPGKTALLAWVGLWFLLTRPFPKIGATSITEGNLDTNLWPELSKWGQESPLCRAALSFTKTRIAWRDAPERAFIVKRSWPKSADPEAQSNALAGLHGDHVMWLADESGGYPQSLMVTLEAIFSSCVEGKLVQAGNPTHTTGPLYRACTVDRDAWVVITITGDPQNPNRSKRISLEWAQQQITAYGRENPWVMVNVLGEFPPSSINSLLGVEDVERAMKRHLRPDVYDWAQKRIGVDVARFGDDRSVIFPRQGLASFRPIVMRGARTTDIAARVMMAARRWQPDLADLMVLVDDTGHWGHGVIDNLTVARLPVMPIVYSGKALDPRFKNRRAEMWMKGAEAIKNGAALPPIPDLIGELTEPTYTFMNGVFVLEEKDQIKERLQRSPDLADAYMQTYAIEDIPNDLQSRLRGSSKAKTDFDPYASQADRYEEPNGRVTHDFDPNAM